METAARVVVKLTGREDTFELSGNCATCGAVSTGTWVYHNKYNVKRAAAGANGGVVLQDVKDADGNLETGQVHVRLPYCERHLRQSQRLASNVKVWMWLAAGLGTAATIYYLSKYAPGLVSRADTTGTVGFYVCAMPIFLFLAAFAATAAANAGVGQMSGFRDYPYGLTGGASGVEIDVSSDLKDQSVQYDMTLGFFSREAAERFVSQNPQAR